MAAQIGKLDFWGEDPFFTFLQELGFYGNSGPSYLLTFNCGSFFSLYSIKQAFGDNFL